MIKVNDKIKVKVQKNMKMIKDNFVRKLFLKYQIHSYIGEFLNFIYAINDGQDEKIDNIDNKAGNVFVINKVNIINNKNLNIYNNNFNFNINNKVLSGNIWLKKGFYNDGDLIRESLFERIIEKVIKSIWIDKVMESNMILDKQKLIIEKSILVLKLERSEVNKVFDNNYLYDGKINQVMKIIKVAGRKIREQLKNENILSSLQLKQIDMLINDEEDVKRIDKFIKSNIVNIANVTNIEGIKIYDNDQNGNKKILESKIRRIDFGKYLKRQYRYKKMLLKYNLIKNFEVKKDERNVFLKENNKLFRAMIETTQSLVKYRVLKSNIFTKEQKKIVNNIIDNVELNFDGTLKNIFSEKQVYNSIIHNDKRFLNKFIKIFRINLKNNLKKSKVFSNLQLKNFDYLIKNKKNIDFLIEYLNLNIKNISNYIDESNLNLFFKDLSLNLLTNLKKDRNFSKLSNKNFISNQVNNLLSDVYYKYNYHYNLEIQSKHNQFIFQLLSQINNSFNKELFSVLSNLQINNQNFSLKDKINLKKLIQDTSQSQLSFYQNTSLPSFYNLNKNLFDISKNILSASFNKIINQLPLSFSNFNLNSIFNDVFFKVYHDSNINLFINQHLKNLENPIILKNSIFNFIYDNLNNLSNFNNLNNLSNLNDINNLSNIKNINLSSDDFNQTLINSIIDILNSFNVSNYNLSLDHKTFKSKFNTYFHKLSNENIIIYKNIVNHFLSQNKLLNHIVNPISHHSKHPNNFNILSNFHFNKSLNHKILSHYNHNSYFYKYISLNDKSFFYKGYPQADFKSNNIIYQKLTNFISHNYNPLSSKNIYSHIKHIMNNIDFYNVKIHNLFKPSSILSNLFNLFNLSNPSNQFSLSNPSNPFNLSNQFPHIFNLSLSISNLPLIHIDKSNFEAFVEQNSKFNSRNPFNGFEYLKLIHNAPSLNYSTNNPNTINLLNSQSHHVNNPFILSNHTKDNQNKPSHINTSKNINSQENLKVFKQNFDKQYRQLIKKTIDDKFNKDIHDITNQVYHNIEKKLKSEQRRYGLV